MVQQIKEMLIKVANLLLKLEIAKIRNRGRSYSSIPCCGFLFFLHYHHLWNTLKCRICPYLKQRNQKINKYLISRLLVSHGKDRDQNLRKFPILYLCVKRFGKFHEISFRISSPNSTSTNFPRSVEHPT